MTRRRYADVNFSNIPSALTDEHKSNLVDQLQRTGDCTVAHNGQTITIRNLLIESHIALVRSIAAGYNYHDLPELVSVGLLTLTETIDKFECLKLTNDNVTGYIGVAVRRSIDRFIRKSPIIPVQSDAYQRGVRAGKRVDHSINGTAVTQGPTLAVDVRDALDHVTTTRNQKIIGQCMLDGGYKLKDMADMCGIKPPWASVIREKITTDFRKLWWD